MPSSRLSSKGQVVIPKEIRDRFRLKPGDRVDFTLDDTGTVKVSFGQTDFSRLYGLFHQPGRRPLSLEEMEDAIAIGAMEGEGYDDRT